MGDLMEGTSGPPVRDASVPELSQGPSDSLLFNMRRPQPRHLSASSRDSTPANPPTPEDTTPLAGQAGLALPTPFLVKISTSQKPGTPKRPRILYTEAVSQLPKTPICRQKSRSGGASTPTRIPSRIRPLPTGQSNLPPALTSPSDLPTDTLVHQVYTFAIHYAAAV